MLIKKCLKKDQAVYYGMDDGLKICLIDYIQIFYNLKWKMCSLNFFLVLLCTVERMQTQGGTKTPTALYLFRLELCFFNT